MDYIFTKNIKEAETAKGIENIQRDLNIAFYNEVLLICKKLNIEFNIPTGDDFSYGTSERYLLEEKNIPFETIIVETTQISEFNHSRFEIIKIDVEGSELDVLFAIEEYLTYCNLLFIEIIDSQKDLVYDFLENNNFKPLVESKENVGNYIFISEAI